MKKIFCIILITALLISSFMLPTSAVGSSESSGGVSVKGYQYSIAEGKTKIRFISGLESSDCTDFGMIIKCVDENSMAYRFDIKGEKRLDQIKSADKVITASELGSEALYAAVIEGIPAFAYFRIEITPYCYVGDEYMTGTKKILIMDENGDATLTEHQLVDNKSNIKIYGRSIELMTGIACDFSASGIEFNAQLYGGDIIMRVDSSNVSYYTVYINGARQDTRLQFIDGIREYTIAEGLPEGRYNVKLIKQTQAANSTSTLISLCMNGRFLERPEDRELLIEFVGDSITCGYGLTGYPTEGVTNYGGAKYMDATLAYAYKTAELLGADHSLVSLSGWAVLPREDGATDGCIPEIYPETCYKRSDQKYNPARTADIVVIHLGTNDSYNRKNTFDSQFVSASKEFISDVKEMHPGAKIVWVYGSMMTGSRLADFENKLDAIIGDLGGASAGLYSVKVPQNASGPNNSHPNVAAQAQSAEILAEFIRDNLID